MNKLINIVFLLYHAIFLSSVRSCRFTPTCSRYLLDATEKYGSFKGLYLTAKRILSCHPLSKRNYFDPA